MSNLKKRFLTLLLSLAMIVTYMPMSMITAYAEDGDDTPTAAVPEHNKDRQPNGDGTYRLSLDITGDADTETPTAKANVLVVFDVSGSMQNGNDANVDIYTPTTGTTGTQYGYYNGQYVQLTYYQGNWYRPSGFGYSVYNGTRYTRSTVKRGDAAEKVVYDFADALYAYNKTADADNVQMALIAFSSGRTSYNDVNSVSSSNPGNKNTAAWLVQDWTNSESTFLNNLSSTGTSGSRKLKYNGGTNWEAAMQRALDVLGTADGDPTYVVFVTDGKPTFYVTGGNGSDTTWREYRGPEEEVLAIENYNTANHTYNVPAENNTTLYGIYAYGTEADYLDDLIYYSQNGSRRPGGESSATTATTNYYNASDQAALNAAISEIFAAIAETLGVGSVAITDGTTTNVQTEQGVSHLLAVEDGTYDYWLTIPVTGSGPYTTTRADLVSGDEYTVTFTEAEDGSYTATWEDSSGTHEVPGLEGSASMGQFKYHWTKSNDFYKFDPPEAYYDDSASAVKWDLSPVGTLLDGVTYTVTFNVYPSQETYDLIADLDNAEDPAAAYEALDPAIKQYLIRENNGSYTLETNTTTDIAYVDSRVSDEVQHTSFENPPRVATDVSEMDITKVWFNDLDNKAKEDYPDGFTMQVLRGNTVVDSVTVKPDDWADTSYISTGLMRVARDENDNITGIEVLDEGHDYSLKEPTDLTYHWELVMEEIHPMLINGELYTLVKVLEADIPEEMGDADFYTLEGVDFYRIGDSVYKVKAQGNKAAVNAYNERKSNLNLKKVITGNADVATDGAEFEYTIKVDNSKASTGSASDLDSDYWLWFSVYDTVNKVTVSGDDLTVSGTGLEGPNADGYYHIPSGNNITVKLQNGWNLRFTNLPEGSTYTIEESATMPAGFGFDEVDGETTFKVGALPDGAVDLGDGKYTYNGVEYTKKSDTEYQAVYNPEITGMKVNGEIISPNASYQVTYSNEYFPTKVAPKVTKTVSGWDAAEAFDFSIEAADDATKAAITAGTVVMPSSTTVSTGTGMKDGESKTLSFDDITFNAEGTYTFTVKETNADAPAGWTYANAASDAKTITVQVAAGEDGKLAATVTGDNPTFTNSYKAEKTTGKIPVVKNITPENSGANDITGKFTFTLEGKDGAPMPAGTTGNKATVTCGADGVTVFFDEIEFTEAGTYNYSVTESVTDGTAPKDGISLETDEPRTYTVTVTDDGSGKLTTSIKSNEPISFNNPYSVSTLDVVIPVEKILVVPEGLTGPEDIKGKFTFTLEAGTNTAAGGIATPMPSGTGNVVTNPAANGGTANFGQITYSKPGTYNYTVTETGSVAGVTNDKTATKNVVVVVTDNHDGTMGYTINNGSGVSFTNTYSAESTSAVIPVKKVVTGENAPTITDEYTFTLKEGDKVVGTVKSNGSGNIVSFDAIEYTEPGTHTYTVTESGTVEGITNDASEQTVTVTVTDNKEGELEATVSATNENPVVFNNLYRETSIQIPVNKSLSAAAGLNSPDITGKYTFTLTAGSNTAGVETPMPSGTGNVVTNPSENGGIAYFGSITFKTPGEYTYTVTESGSVPGVTNDSTATKTVKVKVYYTTVEGKTSEIEKREIPAVTEEVEEPVLDENGDPVEEPVLDENGEPVLDDEGNPVTKVKTEIVTKVVQEATTETEEVTRATTEEVLVAEIIDGNNLTFTNTYTVNPTTANFPVKKVLIKPEDTAGPNIKGKYTFTLEAGTNTAAGDIETPMPETTSYTNPDADGGSVTFGDITYTAPGTYYYKVTESGTVDGVTNQNPDNGTVTVTVTDDGKGNLSAVASSTTGSPLTFNNTYTHENATATIQVHKDLQTPEGVTGPDITGKYTFTLTGNNGAPMPEGQENVVTNPASGTAAFGTITYSTPGTYTYTVTESGSVIGVVNDAQASTGKTVTVTVEDNLEGELVASVEYGNDTGHVLFTNKYEVVNAVKVTKKWEDSDNQDGIRPSSVTVDLKGLTAQQIEAFNNVGITVPESAEITADEEGNWTYTFTDLPKYALDGTVITYTVEEETTKVITGTDGPGTYEFKVEGDAEKGFTVTNTHTPEKTSLNGTKTWEDEDYEGERPTQIVIELWRQIGNGAKEVVKTAEGVPVTATVTADDDWKYEFNDLPKYAEEGQIITYSIVEQAVGDYLTVYGEIQTNADGTFTQDVTNTNETLNPSTSTFFKKTVGTPNTIRSSTFEFSAVQVTDASGETETENGWTGTGSVTYTAGQSGDQAITFDKTILYKEEGTYYYKITEISKPDGWTASSEYVVVSVEVELKDGKLVATPNGGSIQNNYAVNSTTAKFPVEKELEVPAGLTPSSIANKFTFTLTAGSNTAEGDIETPMPAVSSYTNPDADGGTVTFGDITYTAPGEYNYTVTETGSADGVTNDATSAKPVKVTVVDNGDGTLTATPSVDEENPLTFTNKYDVSETTAGFPVQKVLEVPAGLTPSSIANKFTFTLTAGSNTAAGDIATPMPAVSSYTNPDADGGTVTFGDITYTAPGTYTYTVTETGSADGVTNDSVGSKTVTVTVVDNGDGTLTATPSVDEENPLTFTNKYDVNDTTAKFPVEKELEVPAGLTPSSIANKFTFTLTAGSNTAEGDIETPMPAVSSYTNPDADGGTVTFGDITYTAPGEYNYTVTETGSADGVTNDTTPAKPVKVTVVDNGDGTLTATADSTTDDPLTFTNKYDVSETKAGFPVQKVLEVPEGLTPSSIADKFTFTLTAGSNTAAGDIATPMPETKSYTNPDADGGTVTFGDITYTAPGVYNYTVTETGSAAGVTNDATSAKAVKVTVVDNGDGTLTATADSTTGKPLTFTNKYDVSETTAGFHVKKVLEVPVGLTAPSIANKFTFTLTAGTNTAAGEVATPMPAATSYTNPDADGGTVTFGDITYTAPGVYNYTVTETGKVDGVTNDATSAKAVKVTVVDNGDGTLTATADFTADKPLTFTNKYDVEPVDVDTTEMLTKTVVKMPPKTDSVTFEFALEAGANTAVAEEGETVATPVPVKDGKENTSGSATFTKAESKNIDFGTLTFTKPGVYNYTLTEDVNKLDGGWTTTGNPASVQIEVTDNSDGTMSAEVTGGTITNTFETRVVEGEKTWNDSKYFDENGDPLNGYEEPSVTINLLADGKKVDSKVVTAEDDWKYSFTDLPVNKDHGTPIVYTIEEIRPEGFTDPVVTDFDVENTPVPDEEVLNPTSFEILKTDAATGGAIGTGAEFTLYKGEEAVDKYTTGENGRVEVVFEQGGHEDGTYTLKETKAPEGYDASEATFTIVVDKEFRIVKLNADKTVWQWIYDLVHSSTNAEYKDGVLTVPNPPILTKVTANKVWNDNKDKDKKRPTEIKLTLTGTAGDWTDVKTQTVKADADGNWSYTWTDLVGYHNGTKVVYEVAEDPVKDYTTTYSKMTGDVDEDAEAGYEITVTNNHQSEPLKEVFVKDVTTNIDNKEVKPGQEIQYVITYVNTTGKKAEKATITDTIPKFTSFLKCDSEEPPYQISGDKITWDLGEVEDGGEVTVSFWVKVDEDCNTSGEAIKNEAVVNDGKNDYTSNQTSNPTPPKKEVYTGTSTTNIDGEVVKPGQELTYSIKYTNPKDEAVKATITDTIPEHTTYVDGSISEPGTVSGKDLKWVVDVEAGKSVTVTFKVTVDADVSGEALKNDSTVRYGDNEYKSNQTSNPTPPKKEVFTGTSTTNIDGEMVKPGQELTYSITYTNPKDEAVKATITDTIPEHTTYVDGSISEPGTVSGKDLKWVVDVEAGKSVIVTFKVTVDADVSGEMLHNESVVNDGKNEYKSNQTSNPTPPQKTVYKGSSETNIDGQLVKGGDELTYKIKYTNSEDKAATVDITDDIPKYTTFVSADNGGVKSGNSVKWSGLSVPAKGSITVTLKVKVDEDTYNELLSNEATVKYGDNTYTSNKVTNPTPPEKEVFQGGSKINIDGKAAEPGQKLTYKITYKNLTGKTAEKVTITDKIPAHTSFVSASDGGTQSGGTVTWTFENVAADKEITVELVVFVEEDLNGEGFSNTANVNDGENSYDTNTVSNFTPVKHDPPVLKIVDGDEPEEDETFVFELKAIKNTAGVENPMPEGSSGKTKRIEAAVGTPEEFGDIVFRVPGEYWYEISEVDTGLDDYEYDDTVYTLHYTLTVEGDSLKMELVTTSDDGTVVTTSEYSFVNTYTTPEEPKKPKKPDTGDHNNLGGWLALMMLAGASGAGLYARRRREDQ